MTYLLAQLWLCLLIAGLIGSIIGWILRGGCKRYVKAMEEMQGRYVELERENSSNRKKLEELSKLSQQRNGLLSKVKKLDRVKQQNAKLSTHLMKMQLGIKKARSIYEKTHKKLKKTEEVLAFAKQSNQAKDVTINQLKREAIVADNLLLKYQAQWKAKYSALQKRQQADLKKATGSIQTFLAKAKNESGRLVEVEGQLAEKSSAVGELSTKLTELEREKNNAVAQLNLFQDQSKEYIANIAEENRKYKAGVSLLEQDIQMLEERNNSRAEELDKIDATLKSREQEIENLKEQLEIRQATLNSQSETDHQEKEVKAEKVRKWIVPKVNLLSRHVRPSTQAQFAQAGGEVQEALDLLDTHSMDHDIEVIYGVGKAYAERLEGQGISTTQDLLIYFQRNSTENTYEVIEKDLARMINVEVSEVKSWRIMADLLRLDGLSNEYAKSLELSGISSVEELADKKVSGVLKKMTQAMQNERRIKKFPKDEEILAWITQAKLMPAMHISVAEEQALDKSSDVINSSSESTSAIKLSKWKRVKKIMGKYRRK